MSKWEQYKQRLGDTRPWDLLNPNTEWSEKEDSQKRLDVCLSCDRLIKATKQCKECGCFMNMKVKLKEARCPLGKW